MRRLVSLLATVVSAALLAPTPSVQASTEVITVTFDGEITLWDSYNKTNPTACIGVPTCSSELWAPISTNAACNPQCPVPPAKIAFWALGTPGNTPAAWVPCTAVTAGGTATSCFIRGIGAIHLTGSPIPGPYCYGAFQGTTNVLDVSINGHQTGLRGNSTPPPPAPGLHTWPTMRWTVNSDGLTSDAGVATMTMAEPEGRCGLDPANPVPMHRTNVTGTITWADPQ